VFSRGKLIIVIGVLHEQALVKETRRRGGRADICRYNCRRLNG